MSAALSFSHGANDAQKAVGVIAALLLARGARSTALRPRPGRRWPARSRSPPAPRWAGGGSFAPWAGASTGSSRSRAWPARPLRLGSSSAPRCSARRPRPARSSRPRWSGIGAGRRRLHHVHWAVVRQMGLAWLITMPVTAALAACHTRAMATAHMKRGRWFLPETPDVLGLLRHQLAVTIEGAGRLRRLGRRRRACGAAAVRRCRASRRRVEARAARAVCGSLRHAARARGRVRAVARGSTGSSTTRATSSRRRGRWSCAPDAGIAEMARLLGEAARQIDEAIGHLGSDGDAPPRLRTPRSRPSAGSTHVYYQGMARCSRSSDMRERIARRELYRRCSRIGEMVSTSPSGSSTRWSRRADPGPAGIGARATP